jgi:hypothetical protein
MKVETLDEAHLDSAWNNFHSVYPYASYIKFWKTISPRVLLRSDRTVDIGTNERLRLLASPHFKTMLKLIWIRNGSMG